MSNEVPEGWASVALGDLARVEWGNTSLTKKAYIVAGAPAYSASGQDGYVYKGEWHGPGVVLSAIGARCGKCFLADGDWTAIKNTIVIQADPQIVDHRFLWRFLDNEKRWPVGGSGQPFITMGGANTVEVPLPPLPEQRRIVEKVEALLADVEAARQRLAKVPLILKRFRQAVLAAACSGELTQEWRFSPNSSDQQAHGGLPESWDVATIGSLVQVATGSTPLRKRREYYEGGTVPWIKSGAVNVDPVLSAEEFITDQALRETNAKVFPPGTLLVAMYGEGATRGKVSELGISAATNQALAALLFTGESEAYRPMIKLALQAQYSVSREISAGGVQPNLSLGAVRGISVPVPPLEEQAEIVRRVEALFVVADAIEERLKLATARAEKLPQAILSKAFLGELVPTEAELARAERRGCETAEEMLRKNQPAHHKVVAKPNGSRKSPSNGRVRQDPW